MCPCVCVSVCNPELEGPVQACLVQGRPPSRLLLVAPFIKAGKVSVTLSFWKTPRNQVRTASRAFGATPKADGQRAGSNTP